jgi:hypothetical protein
VTPVVREIIVPAKITEINMYIKFKYKLISFINKQILKQSATLHRVFSSVKVRFMTASVLLSICI